MKLMSASPLREVRSLWWPVLTGVCYYLAAAVALAVSHGRDGIATVWPSSGILLAALLINENRQRGWHLATAAAASMVVNLNLGNGAWISTGFTIANIMESSLAAWLMLNRSGGQVSLSDPVRLLNFCAAALVATLVSASTAWIFVSTTSFEFWLSWFSTDLLGILLVTPLIMIGRREISKDKVRRRTRTRKETFGIFTMVALVCALTFAQSAYPLLFLPMLAILIAVTRLGLLGAAGGVVIAGIIASVASALGSGPVMLIDAGPQSKSLFLQFYLLALFAAALPIGSLLAARHRLLNQLAESVRLLRMAETAANLGHWNLDIVDEVVSWSPEVFNIHGVSSDKPPTLHEAIYAYHPSDRHIVAENIERAIKNQQGFEFQARIIRPNGEVRHILSRGEYEINSVSRKPCLFGIIQDITAQVVQEQSLRAASVMAETAAAEARMMAETDQLTGIANRRRLAQAIEQEIDRSERTGQPFAIAIFDLDHFKQINDRFGHNAGDRVLKRVAADAVMELRHGDILGRFGGEEFVILFPRVGADVALKVAERVRHRIEFSASEPAVTISIGVAELVLGESAESILRRADEALYLAKDSGRNTLRLAS
jgi:diguanylate cyclase (GGDEF)-like protein/PAS domain S-box-containing protein